MVCPHCQYVMDAFDATCPRCHKAPGDKPSTVQRPQAVMPADAQPKAWSITDDPVMPRDAPAVSSPDGALPALDPHRPVSDGDTIKVMLNGKAQAIRLYGIDCPEKSQALGTRARQYTSAYVFGITVTVFSKGTDRYGRV